MTAAHTCPAGALAATGLAAWLATTGHPTLALLPAWAALNLALLGGLVHRGRQRQRAAQTHRAYPDNLAALEAAYTLPDAERTSR
jgi:hypothetical protein